MQADPQDPSPPEAAQSKVRAKVRPEMRPEMRPPMPVSRVLLALFILSSGVELVLIGADYGLIGTPRWRGLAYQNGAFWAGLLYNWRPNYDVQPALMFVTYAFLHSGLGHLGGNMLTLFFLGGIIRDRVGERGLMALYAISAIGGAAAFAALSSSPQPMVGASGALFGLAGAWQYWEWRDRRRAGLGTWVVWRMVLGLILLNVVLWWWMGGRLAWETHLGGFITGWLAAAGLAQIAIGAQMPDDGDGGDDGGDGH